MGITTRTIGIYANVEGKGLQMIDIAISENGARTKLKVEREFMGRYAAAIDMPLDAIA